MQASEILAPGGPVEQLLEGYEVRPQQLEMAQAVQTALSAHGIVAVEAGTGTGKSFAYLVPLALHALEQGHPVVVSSSTHVLQDQLISKDIPLVQKALATLGLKLRVTEVKGMGAYACQRDLDDAAAGLLMLESEGRDAIKRLHTWMQKSVEAGGEGSRSEAPRVPEDLWSQIRADRDTCTHEECRFFETCFFFKARRKIQEADLLVANHSLVFADLAVKEEGGQILPKYFVLVLDEAHKVEEAATNFLGGEIGPRGLRFMLNRLQGTRGGAISRLIGQLRELKLPARQRESLSEFLEEQVGSEVTLLIQALEESFGNIERAYRAILPSESARPLRLVPRVYQHGAFVAAQTAGHYLTSRMELLAGRIRTALSSLQGLENLFLMREAQLLRSTEGKLLITAAQVRAFFDPMSGAEDTVKWFQPETSRRHGLEVRLASAPLEVGPHLEQRLFKRLDAAVLTSATLAVGESFDYLSNRLGLAGELAPRRSTLLLGSPFDFAGRVLAGFPLDLPDPEEEGFLEAAARFLWRAIRASKGRSLVLFQSWAALRKTHDLMAPHAGRLGFRLMAQGEMSKKELIDTFRADVNSVLLATAGYREGVDVPGESLCNLILHRLPFTVPDEPVTEARVEAITRAGNDPFRHYTLPAAVLSFKQAFGRLIRRTSDYGVFLCLDKRVITKRYGQSFLAALPKVRTVRGESKQVIAEVKAFLAKYDRT